MTSFYYSLFRPAATALVLLLILGAGQAGFAQKGGKGGKGGGHGRGHGNGGGPPVAAPQIAHPQGGGPPAGRGWRRQEHHIPQPQHVPDWATRAPRQPQIYHQQVVIPQQQYRVEMGRSKHEWKQERKAQKMERRAWKHAAQAPQIVIEQPRRQGPPAWAGVWTAPGQLKKAERRHARESRVYERYYEPEWRQEERRVYSEPERVYDNGYVREYRPNTGNSSVIYVLPQGADTNYYPRNQTDYYSSPTVGYAPATAFGYGYPSSDVNFGQIGYLPDPFGTNGYYDGGNDLFGDRFLGGIDWKDLLLSTVLNVVLGGGGGDDGGAGIFGDILGIGAGSILGGDRSYNSGIFNTDPFFGADGSSYDLSSLGQFGYGDAYLSRETYQDGYEQGYQYALNPSRSGYEANGQQYLLDQIGYGYGANTLSLEQRRSLYEGYSRGYEEALAQQNEYGPAEDEVGEDNNLLSTVLTGLLSFLNI